MKSTQFNNILRSCRVIIAALATVLFISGCQKDNPINPTGGVTVLDDAAVSIANAIGSDNGGALDDIGDIVEIASLAGLRNEAGMMLDPDLSVMSSSNVTRSYDSLTGWWTVTVSRQRSGAFGNAQMNREYQYQFLNGNGQFQKYWLMGGDTAHAVHFKIVSGSGESHSRRLDHHLLSLAGEWMVTGTNTNTVTLNTYNDVAYAREGSDTIKTDNAVRTLNYSLSMKFIDVVGPARSRFRFAAKNSGTITGTYHAEITFMRGGSLYSEKTIDKSFTIDLGGDGFADIHCGGRRFHANLGLGALWR